MPYSRIMSEGSQDSTWNDVKALETLTKELQRAGSALQSSRLHPVTRDRALSVRKECKAVICHLLEHFSSAQLDAELSDDAEELGKAMEDLLDDVLERVDSSLDQARALLKAAELPASAMAPAAEAGPLSAAQPVAGVRTSAKTTKSAAFHAAHMDFSSGPRPQDTFDPSVDNSNEPFRPLLRAWQQAMPDCPASEPSDPPGLHPLQKKLSDLVYQPWQLEAPEPIMQKGVDETPLTYIDTLPALKELAGELASASEVAVDLEAHSYRTFQGFCCLMQLSTRRADYLVDVLALRSFIGPCLGPVFADAKVVKVLHGADSDIVWLQRDFGIYVINLFDTGQAARVLTYPSAGLAYLLSRMCGVKADKRWQLADWRVRPLSEEALLYARMDTHYLLYMYDRIKVELAEVPRVPDHYQADVPARGSPTMLGVVLERSRRLCLSQYQKELLTPTSYLDAYARMQDRLTRQQLAVFAGLFAWRDRVARSRDESIGFVMPKTLLMKLVKGIPRTTQELLSNLGIRGKRSSPLVVELAAEVIQVITASAQTPESVPEPDQLRHHPKQHFAKAVHAVPELPSESNGLHILRPAEQSTAPSQEPCAVSNAERRAGQTPAVYPNISEEQAALQDNAPQQGKCQDMATPPAGQNRPPVSSLQPKAIPSLSIGSQKSSSLFRRPPKSTSTPSVTPVSSNTPVNPSQQGAATPTVAAAPAGAAPAGSLLSHAEAASPATGAAAATAAEQDSMLASDPAGSVATDTSGATVARPASHGALAEPVTQSLPAQRQPTRLGSMFGTSRHASRGPGAAMLSVLSQAQKPTRTSDQAAAVSQLKAQLALPFASSFSAAALLSDTPLQADAKAPDASQAAAVATPVAVGAAPEGEAGGALQRTSGAAVRSVMETIISENRFEVFNSASSRSLQQKSDDKDIPEEYLPLPISEEYQLPSKHRRRSAQGKRTQAAQPESGSKPDNTHLTAAHWAPQTDERTPSASMDRQVSEHALAGSEGPTGDVGRRLEKGKSGSTRKHCLPQQDARDDEAAEQRPLGPVFPRKHRPAESNMHSKQAGSDQQGGKTRPPVSAYDFAAARAEAKGLDVSSIMGLPAKRKAAHNGPSARGGRSSRHAERDGAGTDKISLGGAVDGDRKKQRKQKAFDPYISFEANEIKGGKHKTAMHKMGNRSMTFS